MSFQQYNLFDKIKKTFKSTFNAYKSIENIEFKFQNVGSIGPNSINWIKLSAQIKDKEIAYLSFRLIEPLHLNGREQELLNKHLPENLDFIVKISYIKVENEYKGYGIGRNLMEKVIEWCENNGFKYFYLEAVQIGTNGLNTAALIQFYERLGFVQMGYSGSHILMLKKTI